MKAIAFPQCTVLMKTLNVFLFVPFQDLSRQTVGVDQVICR